MTKKIEYQISLEWLFSSFFCAAYISRSDLHSMDTGHVIFSLKIENHRKTVTQAVEKQSHMVAQLLQFVLDIKHYKEHSTYTWS